ncbi:MAG: thioredoxin family protein [Chloroflexi bacterium]|nr:thioredoxin family protein [Chloroflexota bacterium]
MLERLFLLLILLALPLAGRWVWQSWQNHRTRRLRQQPVSPILHQLALPAQPAILYFSTVTCSQCHFRQTPILNELSQHWGDTIHVRKLDAVAYDDVARHFGIMTTPSTVILDSRQQVQAINQGVANHDRLQNQVEAALTASAVPSPPSHTLAPC